MNAYQATLGGVKFSTGDIFVTRLNSSGNGLIYSSYFGGAVQDRAGDIALGVDGTAYVTGGTSSLDFPIVNGQSFPEADSSDGILIRLDNFGQPVYSVRTNRPGYDEFEGVAVDDSGAALLVGAWNDTIRVYEKAENDSLKNIFEIAAPGHSINAVQFADGFLAFAGTFFPPELNETKRFENDINAKGAQSGSQKSGGLLRIIDLFDIRIIDFGGVIDRLEIVIKKANADGLKVGTDENGKVTINGVSTGINADDVDDIKVIGSDGADCIDLRCVTFENFIGINPSFTGITVEAGGGNDKVIGSADFKNWIFGGDGDDEIQGGDKDDTLHGEDGKDVIFGRGGADFIDGGKEDDRLFGGEGKDDIVGGPGNDLLDGGGEGDFLDGGEGSDNLFGGDGNDTILFDAEDELVKGEKGNDTLTFLEIFFDNKNLNKNGAVVSHEGAVVIADISGVDTLDFAGYDVAISLDLGLLNSPQIIDSTGTQVMLEGIFEVILGTEFDDEISVSPLPDTMRFVDGGGGTDVLNFESGEAQGVDDGSTITTPGFADVAYVNIETVNLSFVSSVRESDTSIPINFSLGNNYPNPFNPSTLIEYSLPEASHVSLKIYNALGQKVLTLVDKQQKAGRFSATFNAKALPSGLYFYSIKAGNYISVKKMLLLK
ncbi:MAG: T9SS type A sorting domain-containing protein [Caldithrix sp.]|nr:MAG: T9SS type A sorting domain-containing protein [Caldithrix sp.]